MSQNMTQSGDEQAEIEQGDLVSDGPDNWRVEATDGPLVPDDEIVLERYDGKRFPVERDQVGRCECGMLVMGEGPCYGCFKTNEGE